ncbi:MAG TPA: tetratricopeptide repeat protein [Pyrinomonadaceae bacterium]|nr:tetratricopeptide repeat protein [Pyrinomonadaceae bacterium]
MKPSSRLAPFAALFLFALCLAPHAARAQSRQGTPGARTQAPAAPAPTPTQTPAQPQTQAQLTPRERRAQAYAKLLEGQRYYEGIRNGTLTLESLHRAQAAFQQAAELEPTLSEAHAALAEIGLITNDLPAAEKEGLAATRAYADSYGGHRVLARIYTLRSGLAEGSVDRAAADRAVAELREVIRVHQNDAEAWALLAELYVATNREKEAIEALRMWATLPASMEGRFYQVVTQGRELSPDAANARLAEVLLGAGRAEEAVAAIRRAVNIEPDNPRYVQLLGEALEAGAPSDAAVIEELKRLAAQNPGNPAVPQILASTQARAGKVSDAVSTLQAAIAAVKPGKDNERLQLQLQLAKIYEEGSRYDDAVGVYEDLLKSHNITNTPLANERDRRFAVSALLEIADLRQQAGQTQEVLAVFERMRALLPSDDPTADLQKAEFLRAHGRRAEALEAARDARKRFPEDLRLLRLEAQTLAETGRVDDALALLRPRLKGDASDFEEYLYISSMLMGAGRGTEAVEAARKALALASPEDPAQSTNALIMLSSAQERAGDTTGAEATLRQVLAKDANNPTALNNLGYFLTEHGEKLDEALGMVERAVRAEPQNPSFLDSLGWAYFKLGKLKEAERYLSDAARRNPTSATIQEHLGDLFQKLGQQEKARATWRKALSLAAEAADTARIKAKLGETK